MLHLTVLGASGATGQELTRQALERGHAVTAIARDTGRIGFPDSTRLIRAAADVRDAGSITRALSGSTIVLSGLGTARGDEPGVLTAGARALVNAAPQRIIWMGAFGTGASAPAAGALTRTLLQTFMKAELGDKTTADGAVLEADGTVFHAGPLSSGPISPKRRTVSLSSAPRRVFPARVSRATVAAAMLDEAESGQPTSGVLVPLER
jgi:hypothetical protein